MAARRGFFLWRIIHARWRLFLSLAVGLAVAAGCFFTDWHWATRLLAAWDAAVVIYLALTIELMIASTPHKIRRQAAREDEGALALLVLTVSAAMLSLVAIIAQLGSAGQGRHPAAQGLAAAAVLLSWIFIHVIFALHYAHEFYGERTVKHGGLVFPGEETEPDYWDFVYFSFVVGMTSQVSDVAVTSKWIRRTVTVHGMVAFVFNVAFLALTVSMAGGLIQGGQSR